MTRPNGTHSHPSDWQSPSHDARHRDPRRADNGEAYQQADQRPGAGMPDERYAAEPGAYSGGYADPAHNGSQDYYEDARHHVAGAVPPRGYAAHDQYAQPDQHSDPDNGRYNPGAAAREPRGGQDHGYHEEPQQPQHAPQSYAPEGRAAASGYDPADRGVPRGGNGNYEPQFTQYMPAGGSRQDGHGAVHGNGRDAEDGYGRNPLNDRLASFDPNQLPEVDRRRGQDFGSRDPSQSLSGYQPDPPEPYARPGQEGRGLRGGMYDHQGYDPHAGHGAVPRQMPVDFGDHKPSGQAGQRYDAPVAGGHQGVPLRHDGRYDAAQDGRHNAQYHDERYDPAAPDGSAVAPHDQAYEDFDEDYEDEPESKGGLVRKLALASVLVVSVVAGGGALYGYKSMFGGAGAGPNGQPPVVRAGAGPDKVQPTDPGGRQFQHTDSRLMKKMGERLPQGQEAPGKDGDNSRVKVVTTMTFDRDGRMIVSKTPQPAGGTVQPTPQPVVSTPAQPGPAASTPVPGMTIVNGDGFGAPRAAREPPPPRVVAETRSAPVVRPLPSNAGTAPVAGGPPLPTRRENRGDVVVRRVATAAPALRTPRIASVTPAPSGVTTVAPRGRPPVAAGVRGYVAVLSTKRTRIEALTSFADLQQKYGAALSSSIPDVQKADLRQRGLGVMYRVVVGPPGSRQAALEVCGRLKSAGYRGCWVKAY
ncbi:MAG TPA: SPOR domain-containing protein [Hyphomicrobiaceae bacterium]|nr:SPOR domain-containing protein [Hyphomicrobiaceae bacterium]